MLPVFRQQVTETCSAKTYFVNKPKKGLVRVCFDRATESAYALNMDNWKVNDVGGTRGGYIPGKGFPCYGTHNLSLRHAPLEIRWF